MKKLILFLVFVLITLICFCCTKKTNKIVIKKEATINIDSVRKLGLPERIGNQYVYILNNHTNLNKSFFIVDTRENLIFFFDSKGKFIAKSPTIDGFDRQSLNPKKIDKSLETWSENVKDLGFKWDKNSKKYIDSTGQNRLYTPRIVYNFLESQKVRFFPKGIYKIPSKYHDNSFIGKSYNTYDVETIDGRKVSLAIHGLYQSEFRVKNMNILLKNIKSNYNETIVPESYKKLIDDNNNNCNFNNSYGCINVPEGFLELTNSLAVNSLIFVLGENTNDYLIK